MTKILETVEQFITEQHLLPDASPVLLAVSGGADSMALMHIFSKLPIKNRLIVAHINHQLRGQLAHRDEAFVLAQAKALNLQALSARVDVIAYAAQHKLSIETAARQLRRNQLIAIAHKHAARYIATAHHRNDNAETMVHRLIRGTGYRGLAGIMPAKEFSGIEFIRPLLAIGRDEILEYLRNNNLTFQHDHTNDEIIYTRNFIRHKLLPLLQQQSKSDLTEALNALASHSLKLSQMLTVKLDALWPDLTKKHSADHIELSSERLRQLPYPLLMEAIRRALIEVGCGERDVTHDHYQHIASCILEDKHTRIALPDKIIAHIGPSIIFARQTPTIICQDEPVILPIPGTVQFGGFTVTARLLDASQSLTEFRNSKTSTVEWFDLDKIAQPLTLRLRKDGDSFWPIGMNAQKKVGQFLSDSKLPQSQRMAAFIVADTEKIIWLAPVRPSEHTKITPDTRKLLEIACSR